MNTFMKTVVIGTAPAFIVAGALRADVTASRPIPLDEPTSQPSTQPAPPAVPVPPPIVITTGIRL